MSFCGKCGTKIPDNTTVCPNCGVDGKPKTVSPTGGGRPSGKKEKKPAKKRGALLAIPIVLVVLAAAAVCIWKFALPSGPAAVNVPEVAEDGSADPNIWKAYQLGLTQLVSDGADYNELELGYLSAYSYDMALCGASCLQMTVCALLGDTSALACPDWHTAATITRSAPFPAFFQGLICEFKGDADGAAEFYRQAELYYGFSQKLYAFRYLQDATIDELESIKSECETIISAIGEVHTNVPYADELGEIDFMAGYHQAIGDLCAENEDYATALLHYEQGLKVNPYDPASYAACAMYALYAGDPKVATYLSEGLVLEPEDAGLNLLSAMVFESQGEYEVALYYLTIARQDETITADQLALVNDMQARMGGEVQ